MFLDIKVCLLCLLFIRTYSWRWIESPLRLPNTVTISIRQFYKSISVATILGTSYLDPVPATATVGTGLYSLTVATEKGTTTPEAEVFRAFSKAKQLEYTKNFPEAQKIYEEIVNTTPDFIYGWSNLGNVLVAQGDLPNSLLCYKKALSLQPPRDTLPVILLNKAVVEMNLGDNNRALDDLIASEKLGGKSRDISVNKAVAYSRTNHFAESAALFDSVIDSSDKFPLPWWLRYSVSLFETDRNTESVVITKRVLNRFPEEPECNAFAAALFSKLGFQNEALQYWNTLSVEDKQKYSNVDFLKENLYWGPKSMQGMQLLVSKVH